jgi:hypothetical protein
VKKPLPPLNFSKKHALAGSVNSQGLKGFTERSVNQRVFLGNELFTMLSSFCGFLLSFREF